MVPMMGTANEEPLESWPRPEWVPGGGDALVEYVVFGSFNEPFTVSRSKHRVQGVPEGVKAGAGDSRACRALTVGPFGDLLGGTVKDPRTLDYLRDSVGLVTAALDGRGVAVLDTQRISWFTGASWSRWPGCPRACAPSSGALSRVSTSTTFTSRCAGRTRLAGGGPVPTGDPRTHRP